MNPAPTCEKSPSIETERTTAVVLLLRCALFAFLYLSAADLGHWLSIKEGDFAMIWPPAGVFVAALLLTPYRHWPFFLGSAIAANLVSDTIFHGKSFALSAGFCLTNTTTAVLIAGLIRRSGPPLRLQTIREVALFAAISAAVELLVSAPAGAVLMLWQFGTPFWETWMHWWLSDVAGIWMTAPLILVIARSSENIPARLNPLRVLEGLVLFLSLAAISYGIFFRQFDWFSIPAVPVLWILWAALRFGSAGVGVGMFVLAITAGRSTALGVGVFTVLAAGSEQAMIHLLTYLGAWFLVFHMVAASLAERSQAAAELSAANLTLENRVAERTAELTSANSALREAKEAAEAASNAKDDFLAALSHELRTPLTPVLLVASAGHQNKDLSAEVREDFLMIKNNVLLEARLIDDLLDLTRIAQGRVELSWEDVDLHALVQQTLDAARTEIEQRSLRLAVELTAPAYRVRADPVRLQQVIWNLLKNAVKFTPKDGWIRLRTTVREHRLELTVSDSGIGITATELPRLFQKFEQGDNGKKFGGLGLGLAISRTLIELHGGHIFVESAGRNEGATFQIELPLLDPKTSLESAS